MGLTPREYEILKYVADYGYDQKNLASHFSVTLHTISNHVASILMKLDAYDMKHAIGIGFRTGILDKNNVRPLLTSLPPSYSFPSIQLTPADIENLTYAANGFCYKEIAKIRGVTERTIKKEMSYGCKRNRLGVHRFIALAFLLGHIKI